jgi:hypothetical protein
MTAKVEKFDSKGMIKLYHEGKQPTPEQFKLFLEHLSNSEIPEDQDFLGVLLKMLKSELASRTS